MRSPARICAAVCGLAVVALLLVSAFKRTDESFTLGVAAALPVVPLDPGQEACQERIRVPPSGNFDRVAFKVGTYGRPGPELAVEIRDSASRRVLARGTLAAGYADVQREPQHVVRVGEVPASSSVAACVRNDGPTRMAIFGNPDAASLPTTAEIDGVGAGVDLALRFERSPRSLLSLVGAFAARAALFKVSWFGAWTFWLLGALVLVAVPVLLVRAVRGLEE
ncbi:hypothetical protein C8N24_2722 [Solirubrobacter pauli]|uniref:Uncharacterized protein n=1 Tax=Solirubrobacter pauli TaxID=166793 RepID=A0A660LEY5_9ACTN|nr:hypothetical protein [Solirubrobacter pauli]RKQ92866.1 hypothetical protein C8N24_2722 [Solirubrobacter pauli]